jgi:insulysin
VTEEDSLEFMWVLDYQKPLYKSRPIAYLINLLNHEGPGSLLSVLVDEGLALNTSTASEDDMNLFTSLFINITLTSKGVDEFERVFAYLKMVKEKGPQEWFFQEVKTILDLQFRFQDKEEPMDHVSDLAETMHDYPIRDVIASGYIFEEYRPDLIEKVLNSLTLDNLRVVLVSKKVEQDCVLTEKWYGTKYFIEPLSTRLESLFNNPTADLQRSKKKLEFPPQNTLLPTDLKLHKTDDLQSLPLYPVKIIETNSTDVWFKRDNFFLTPKGHICLQIHSKR